MKSENVADARFLIDLKANVNFVNYFGQSPLSVTKNEQIIELLLEKNANIELKLMHETTALFQNMLLLKYKANVNAIDIFGESPLFNATCFNKQKTVKKLIDYKADVFILNKRNVSVLKMMKHLNKSNEAEELVINERIRVLKEILYKYLISELADIVINYLEMI